MSSQRKFTFAISSPGEFLVRNWHKAAELSRITQNNGHYAVQGHSRSSIFGTKSKAHMDSLLVVNTNLRPISHWSYCRLFVKFALSMGYLCLTHSFRVNPKLTITKFGLKRRETTFYHVVPNTFRYLEPFTCGSRVWRTDRRTDRTATERANDTR